MVRRGGVTLPTIRRTKKSDIELAVLALECVLLRRPLLSSRCSRWHRVPRPRRVDGATCHAIDAMPHAGAATQAALLDADRACALGRRRGGVDCGR